MNNRVTISVEMQDIELAELESGLRDACCLSDKINPKQSEFMISVLKCLRSADKRYDKYAETPTMFDVLKRRGVEYPMQESVSIMERQERALWSARRLLEIQTGKIIDDIELEDGSYKNFNVLYQGSGKWTFVRLG
jgi:hypothetical protein